MANNHNDDEYNCLDGKPNNGKSNKKLKNRIDCIHHLNPTSDISPQGNLLILKNLFRKIMFQSLH